MEDSVEEKEPSEVLTPDTENATYFNANETDDSNWTGKSPVNYKRLLIYNRNTWKNRWEENKEVTHRQDNLAILDALSGQLELNNFQKEKSRRVFDELDLGDLGKSVRLIAFGVCAVVANEDVHDGSRYHPQMDDPDELFVEMADRLDFTTKQLHSVIGVVGNERR